jgi:hypothetical protein
MVQAHLAFTAPRTGFPNITEATLVIDAPRWRRLEIPLRLIIGRFYMEVASGFVSINQGASAGVIVAVSSLEGPGDQVHFSLEGGGGRVRLAPPNPVAAVMPDQRDWVHLMLFVDHEARLGWHEVTLEARVFDQLQLHRMPFTVYVTPGGLNVGTRPFSITAKQGDTVTFEVFANSEGPIRTLTIRPGALPKGVHIEPANLTLGPGRASRIQPIRLSIERHALTTDRAWMPIHWTANNGIHEGILNVPLTIELTPDERVFRQEFTTPDFTALGGFAEVVIRNDGSYTFRGQMHGSGFDPYDFRIGFYLATSIITLADTFTSRVGGSVSGGPRNRDWDKPGHNPLIQEHWAVLRNASCTFQKWYQDAGVLGTVQELAATLLEFVVLRALVGPAAASILILGPELAHAADLSVTRPRAIPGTLIVGGVVMLAHPLLAVTAVVAGVAIAAADDVKSRRMHPSEIAEAKKVFGDRLPIDKIRVTNLLRYAATSGEQVPFFNFNHMDETYLVSMGNAFHTEIIGDKKFIHELTHVWQWRYGAFSPAKMWGEIDRALFMSVEEERALYTTYSDGRPWRDFHSEGQAVAVHTWYDQHRSDLDSVAARNHVFFRYIHNNIRMGRP